MEFKQIEVLKDHVAKVIAEQYANGKWIAQHVAHIDYGLFLVIFSKDETDE